MLPVSLDCPFLIAPSVFSNLYYTMHDLCTTHIFVLFHRSLCFVNILISIITLVLFMHRRIKRLKPNYLVEQFNLSLKRVNSFPIKHDLLHYKINSA